MKKVLLPTDLTVQSLWPIHNIVRDAQHQKLTIHAVHMLSLPTSISDLFSAQKNKPYHALPANFKEACHMLRNKYNSSIENIRFTFVYGNTLRYVNNFIEGYHIDAIATVFFLIEKMAIHLQDPIENKPTDTPMTAICYTIERDLKQVINETYSTEVIHDQQLFYVM